jgi:hypothetical protein
LVNAITGGAQEELSLQKFEKDVEVELQKAASAGGPINKQQIATSLFRKLSPLELASTRPPEPERLSKSPILLTGAIIEEKLLLFQEREARVFFL